VNSDYPLRFHEKLLYFVFNFLNNSIDLYFDRMKGVQVHFLLDSKKTDIVNPVENSSPNRYLCNAFWSSLNFKYLRTLLSGHLSVVDVGCGTGIYSKYFELGTDENYLGVDLFESKEWQKYKVPQIEFKVLSYLDVDQYLTQKNVLITQSALEHFTEDLLFIKKIGEYVTKRNQELIQIHLIPARSGLRTGLLHGIRQYNLRTIKNIFKSAAPLDSYVLISLGGRNSNRFHWKFITRHQIFHQYEKIFSDKKNYAEALKAVCYQDNSERNLRKATFYGLIFSHNLQMPLRPEQLFTS